MSATEANDTATEQTLPRRIEKPWGYEIWWAATDQYVGKILHVNKGHRLSLQYHEKKDESCYVLAGRLILVQGASEDSLTERTIGVGDVWRNKPATIHTIEALEDADVLEASTPYLDDVVRLRDDYGREGTSQI
jgi:mannose-6-phosphate isomerase-like protein (cupin superfamily)